MHPGELPKQENFRDNDRELPFKRTAADRGRNMKTAFAPKHEREDDINSCWSVARNNEDVV